MSHRDLMQESVETLLEQDRDCLWHHLTQHKVFQTSEPLVMVEGRGLILKDIRGREYLDAASGGVWCVNVGYGRDSIADAVSAQLKKMPYYAGTAGNIPTIRFACKVISLLPGLGKVFFSSSGSEANEKAFKMVRQYFRLKYKNRDKYKILYRNRDYHGTTLAALSASGQQERKEGYGPFLDGFVEFPHACCYRCPVAKSYPGCGIECALALEAVIQKEGPDTVGAIIVEPITAGGGIIAPVKEYYPLLQKICRKYEVLMIMDEVVCGFGRTGKMFGHEHFDVDPDMVTLAKGMASAYVPLSATVVKNGVFDLFLNDPVDKMAYFRDISTYGGCAGACAAALESTRIIEEEHLCENSRVVGDYLLGCLEELRAFPIVGDVRGRGLFAGIEFVEDRKTKQPVSEPFLMSIIQGIADQGVLVGRTNRSLPGLNNIINLAPALVATRDDIDRIVSAIRNAIAKVSS
jgi:taurine-pyruvate aminotransferase